MTTQSHIVEATMRELGITPTTELDRQVAAKFIAGVANQVVASYDGGNGHELMLALAYTVGFTSRVLS